MTTLFRCASEIEASLRDAGVDPADAKALASRAKPYVQLVTTLVDEADIPPGATKIGGAPDLPAGMPWPWRSPYPDHAERLASAEEGAAALAPERLAEVQADTLVQMEKLLPPEVFQSIAESMRSVDLSVINHSDIVEHARSTAEPAPLSFIAQVDLAKVWATGIVDPDIPREGRLLFFYDADHFPGGFKPDDAAGARLIYDLSPISALKRATPPREITARADFLSFPAQRCAMQAALSPPFVGSPEWSACEFNEEADDALSDWWSDLTAEGHDHRVGGHPLQIQGDMAFECALVSKGLDYKSVPERGTDKARRFEADAANWLLLLQIASDKKAGMLWGDMGNLYVWIRRDALRAHRFDEARVIFQCY